MVSFADAQRDMRFAYYNGATGAVTSATVWLIAAIVISLSDTTTGIVTLLIGGMLIFPISVLLDKILGRPGSHSKDNPLGSLAMEGTAWMIFAIPIAVGVAIYNVAWFFPAMLLIIGGRYLTFKSLFGLKIYWLFGATLAVSAIPLVMLEAPVVSGAYTGALIEFLFAAVLFSTKSRE